MSDYKLNKTRLKEFSNRFSIKLCKSIYKEEQTVNVNKLKTLTQIPQVNYFVINALFLSWKEQLLNSRSPYFDYESPDVKEAQKSYMNVLSRHIAIQEQDMRELLLDAVYDTLYLLLSPYEFYKNSLIKLAAKDNQYLTTWLSSSKYIILNVELKNILCKLIEKDLDKQFKKSDIQAFLDKAWDKIENVPDDLAPFMTLFEIDKELGWDFFFGKKDKQKGEESNKKQEAKATKKSARFTNMISSEEEDENDMKVKPLGLKLGDDNTYSIREKITLNQRFMFISELFHGNVDQYDEVMRTIDELEDVEEVQNIISAQLVPQYEWDPESTEVAEFMELVRAKFS